jgi:hypothetical protein
MPRWSEWADFLQRFKLILRPQDQPLLAFALTIGGLAFMIYYGASNLRDPELITLDLADRLNVRQSFQYQLDPNTDNWAEWSILPGIGEKLARGIVDYRQQQGNFQRHEDIQLVPRIGNFKRQQLTPFMLPMENSQH